MSDQKQTSLLLAKWDELRAKGQEITPEELCRDFPTLLTVVKQNIEAIIAVEKVYPEGGATVEEQTADRPAAENSPGNAPSMAGRYQVRQEIARGGMGVVYRAVDPDFDRDLAVKVMLADSQKQPDHEKRFQEEARITGRLQHPGIPPVHEKGRLEDGRPFFAMKLIEGQTLEAILRQRNNQSDVSRFIGIFEQICQTLAYAHSRGVIHRDLKPANIMVGAFGEVQVMDWGLAKRMKEEGGRMKEEGEIDSSFILPPSSLTRTGAALGTPRFMPPEQARGEVDRISEQSDVFGLGGILCAILTDQPPFAGTSAVVNMLAAIEGNLADAFQRLDRCGAEAELIRLAKRCLAADQSDRPHDAGAVAQTVSAYLQSVQEKLRRADVERAAAEVKTVEERRRRKWTLAAAAALVLLLAGGVVGAVWYQQVRYEQAIRQTKEFADSLNMMKRARERAEILTGDLPLRRQHLNAAQKEKTQLQHQLAGMNSAQSARLSEQFQDEKSHLEKAEADHRLLAAYEQLDNQRVIFATKQTRRQFEADLEEFLEKLDDYCSWINTTEKAATMVQSRPMAMQRRLRHIFHVCFAESCQSKHPRAERLRMVLDQIDSDSPWRRDVRAAMIRHDDAKLADLSKQTEDALRDPTVLYLFSQRLPYHARIDFLRHGQREFSQDFWINHELARSLQRHVAARHVKHTEEKKALLYDSVRFYAAAAALRPNNYKVLLNYGTALHIVGRFSDALDVWQKAKVLKPGYAETHYNIGCARMKLDEKERARDAFAKSIACRADYARAHYNKGFVNVRLGNMAEAEKDYDNALKFDDRYVLAYLGRGTFRREREDYDGAIADFTKAIEIFPKFHEAHGGLGASWYRKSLLLSGVEKAECLSKALLACNKAISINPGNVGAYSTLGLALAEKGRLAASLDAFKMAIHIDPNISGVYSGRGMALRKQGKVVEAASAFEQAMTLSAPDDKEWREAKEQRDDVIKDLLVAWRKGEVTESAELLLLANHCRNDKQDFPTAAALYEEAFKAQPSLAADLQNQHRFNAACCAVLAAGELNEPNSEVKGSAESWRKKAHAWLREDHNAWKDLRHDQPFKTPLIEQQMLHWAAIEQLTTVRAPKPLAALPKPQRQTWKNLWNDVAELKIKASAGYREIVKVVDGKLSTDMRQQSFDVKLSAGKTYVVELNSDEFNTFLYLENPDGEVMALNDDIAIGKNSNSRLVFTPKQDDNYRIVATGISRDDVGAFSLNAWEFSNMSDSIPARANRP